VQVQKGKTGDFGGVDHSQCRIVYDFYNNQFFSFRYNNADTRMEAFTISNFKKGDVSSGFVKEFLSKRISQFKRVVYGEEANTKENGPQNPFQLNLIQRIMKNVTTPVLINASRKESEQAYP
jgi:hypothetical protein